MRREIILATAGVLATIVGKAFAQQVSRPVTLQWFESSWRNIERRTPDLFSAGYGALWTPPPGRAVYLPQGGGIGYDVYDRFDLGSPRDPTLYGTESQYIAAVRSTQKFGGNVYVDYVHHHVGSLDLQLNGYTYPQSLIDQGAPYLRDRSDYPGFELSDPNNSVSSPFHRDTYADLYGPNAGQRPFGEVYEYWFRLGENLVTIDLASTREFVRNPVPGESQNIRASTQNWAIPTTTILPNGVVGADTTLRQANVARESNRRFYPDRNGTPRTVIDNGISYTVHDFDPNNPAGGDPVAETTIEYMMRYAQWLTQVIGVDGLRVDAARHVPLGNYNPGYNPNSLDVPKLIDRAVAGASLRTNLDGTKRQTIQFQEVFNYDAGFLASFVRKDQPAGDTVNPNRDVLDFSLWAAMANNMTGDGLRNNWFGIRSASVNAVIQGTSNPNIVNNGANGIGFVYNHDEGVSPPGLGQSIVLDNVAHAWILTRPGDAYVYYRSDEFNRSGNNRFFLKQGRGDALGGQYGQIITTLLDVRNTHGRGDFIERYIDNAFAAPQDQKSAIYVYERAGSMVVALNVGFGEVPGNPGNFTERNNVGTTFAPGTRLIELTGNHDQPGVVDAYDGVPAVVTVNSSGQIPALRIPWNTARNGNKGYVIYGLPTPTGTLSLSNVSQTLSDPNPTPATNGTARLTDIDVISSDTFSVTLNTNNVILPDGFVDVSARGDRALLRINDGFDANGNGFADNPSSAASNATKYGFESFLSFNSPGFNNPNGTGHYEQIVDAAALGEGYHYLTARAWRKQNAGEQEVFTDFRKVIYVDRLDPESTLDSTAMLVEQSDDRVRDIRVRSLDQTADTVHVLFDVPVTLSDSQVLAMISGSNKAEQIDRDLFGKVETNVGSGNHTAIAVTYEITGRYSIDRFAGQAIITSRGAGLGDTNFDGSRTTADVSQFESVLYSNATATPLFNAAADLNANGVVDTLDLLAQPGLLTGPAATEAGVAIVRRGDVNQDAATNSLDIDSIFARTGQTAGVWFFDLDTDGVVGLGDVSLLVEDIFDTVFGDADLDGSVGFADLLAVARNYDQPAGWAGGNFDGDSLVGFADLLTVARAYHVGTVLGPDANVIGVSPAFAADWQTARSLVVPEPAAGAVAAALCVILTRRRRQTV